MNMKAKIALLAVMVIGVLPTAANAYACDGGSHNDHGGVAAASYTLERDGGYGLLHASATYLGLTVDQLKSKLAGGQSLAQVANATSGKSASGLVDSLSGLVKTKLDKLVAAHKLTSAQESALLTRVDGKLTKLVSVSFAHSGERVDWHH
jgi:hypothetical protein